MDAKTIQRLESLGYVSTGAIKEDFEFNQNAEDPKDSINFHVLFSLAGAMISDKKYDQAMEIYQQLLVQRPEVTALHIKMGELSLRLKNPEDAVSHLKKALSLDGQKYLIYEGLGITMMAQGKSEEAIKYFSKMQSVIRGANKAAKKARYGAAPYMRVEWVTP